MPLYNPVNVPVTGPQGLNQWNLGVPDLGGGAYVSMAKQVMQSMDKASENVGSILQQRAGTSSLLSTMANAKIPGTDQNMFDPEMMNKLAKGPLAAQQQFLGTAMSTYQQAQESMAQQTAQQRILQMFSNPKNAPLLRAKMLMEGNIGGLPSAGSTFGGSPTQTTDQANPPPEQTKEAPKFTAPKGFSWSQEKFPGTDHDIHALRDNKGSIVGLYNPDGSLYGQ